MLRHLCPFVLRSVRNLRDLFLLGTLLCLLAASSAQATDRLVPSQYATIQAAIDAAAVGDTVLLADGTYTGVGNRDLDFGGKDITVRSQSGNPAACTIDCQQSGRGFIFQTGETAAAIVADLTIQNGSTSGGGGGVSIYQSSPTITNCTFIGNSVGNSSGSRGGGVTLYSSNSLITNCTFARNSAAYGGGIYSETSSPTVTNCNFTGNSVVADGGGMCHFGSSPTVTNCNFTGNSAVVGGGLYEAFSDSILTNCTFFGNSADDGGGIFNDDDYIGPTLTNCAFIGNSASISGGGIFNYIYCYMTATNCTFTGNTGGAILEFPGFLTLTNCILWGDTDGEIVGDLSYSVIMDCDMQGSPATPDANGNFGADPLFVRNPFTNGPTDFGDLHLQYTSPCFNVGNNAALPLNITTDLDGNPRIAFGTVDLGAYELQAATIVSGQVQVTRGGFRRNAATGRYVQTVTLKNIGASAINGPISLVLDNLSGNAVLYSKTGSVGFLAPIGSPYQNTDGLNPGASVTLTLEFTNPTNAAITYTTRILAGTGAR